ncbi:hypothetical protein V502_03539 [Pseudogymnoascus sp. VKM F-4520 (FW-2644)]|nr:hypothetical protein V502_03539 [Pseudogymnoascus sp. VKM F-4520 (FW-2644)]
MAANPQIHATWLPDGRKREMYFLETSFFKDNGPKLCLPTPEEVRALLGTNHNKDRPPPGRFEHLNLIVKWGPNVTVSEAQSLWAIKRVLGDEDPAPELYGWRVDGRDVFIYMECVQGETLKDRWGFHTDADKTLVCDHLRQIITSLRRVEQDPNDTFIGSPNRQHLLDYVLEDRPGSGPFATVKQFHDRFSRLPWLSFPNHESFQDPWRASLPDTGEIKTNPWGPSSRKHYRPLRVVSGLLGILQGSLYQFVQRRMA